MAEVLKGKPVADAIKAELSGEIEALKAGGLTPKLGIVRVGARPDDLFYEGGAKKTCAAVGMDVEVFEFPEDVTEAELEAGVTGVADRPDIHGILMFAPLPAHLDERKIKNLIPVEKDVDCLSSEATRRVFSGDLSAFPPCTPTACMEMLHFFQVPIEGKKCVVIGQGDVVGKPVTALLLNEKADVTVCFLDETGTLNVNRMGMTENGVAVLEKQTDKSIPEAAKEADILIAAAGVARLVKADCAKAGQVVIDVGINADPENPGKYCGDVDFASVEPIVGKISPVPAGVGSVTTSVLCKHTVKACRMQQP